jgi:AhpD family alkylhydroperoxidase
VRRYVRARLREEKVMARIEPRRRRGPLVRLSHWIARRKFGGRLPEPVGLMAHRPLLMHAYSGLELAFERSHKAPGNLKELAEMKAATAVGCRWCLDFGSWLSLRSGVSERQLRELGHYRESDAFSADEKLVIEYAEAISQTPAAVPDELFARLRERFDEEQIVELTWAAAIENLRARFNWALGIESQGYCKDGACALPDTPAEANAIA